MISPYAIRDVAPVEAPIAAPSGHRRRPMGADAGGHPQHPRGVRSRVHGPQLAGVHLYRVHGDEGRLPDRNPYLGDPLFVDAPEWILSKERAHAWRQRIDAGEAIEAALVPPEPPDTTHVTVVDDAGNCVALTHSLGSSSGVITPGLGFMYNNSMVNFHPIAGHPNSIAPGQVAHHRHGAHGVSRDERPVLVLGAPGATRIITSNVQVILMCSIGACPSPMPCWRRGLIARSALFAARRAPRVCVGRGASVIPSGACRTATAWRWSTPLPSTP